jgi:hypothetical protein
MKKYFIILLAGLFVFTNTKAQTDTSFQLIKIVQDDIAFFSVDNLDNIYILNSTNALKKLNPNGDSVAVYNNVKRFGQASLVDVSNPLKILLYYRDFATIVVLDRLLNVRNIIDLRKQNILQVRAIAPSYDNKIWLYDELDNKLKKIDEDGTVLSETSDFRLLFGETLSPQKIFDQDQFVYLYDSAKAVYVFDYFGTLKNKILIAGWQNFKIAGKFIFGSDAAKLYRYGINTFRVDEWKIPGELFHARSFNFTSTRLYALKQDAIEIYSFR